MPLLDSTRCVLQDMASPLGPLLGVATSCQAQRICSEHSTAKRSKGHHAEGAKATMLLLLLVARGACMLCWPKNHFLQQDSTAPLAHFQSTNRVSSLGVLTGTPGTRTTPTQVVVEQQAVTSGGHFAPPSVDRLQAARGKVFTVWLAVCASTAPAARASSSSRTRAAAWGDCSTQAGQGNTCGLVEVQVVLKQTQHEEADRGQRPANVSVMENKRKCRAARQAFFRITTAGCC